MPTFTKRITVNADDGNWNSNSQFSDRYIEFGWRSYDYHSFFRFINVTIPKHAVIHSCKVTFTASSDNSAGTEKRVYCYFNDTATPVAPTDSSEGAALALTSAVSWTMPDFVTDSEYDTPDLAALFQTIVDKDDWASGNSAMVVVKKPDGINTNTSRSPYGYQDAPTKAALLTVTYSAGVDCTNAPFTLASSMSIYSVATPDSLGYAYEESTGGSAMDVAVKTGEGVGKNILQQKQMKYLYYDLNTHGKDVTVTVYIDGVEQTNTITLNTTTRERGRYEDIPDTWQGYRFSLSISCDDVTDDDLEIYAPFAIQYVAFGV
jgi:hypothetical protein